MPPQPSFVHALAILGNHRTRVNGISLRACVFGRVGEGLFGREREWKRDFFLRIQLFVCVVQRSMRS